MTTKLKYTKDFPVDVEIDGQQIKAVIRRMTSGEYKDFALDWNRERQKLRKPVDRRPGEEALSEVQVEAKREAELTIEQVKAKRERDRFDAEESAQFTIDTITKFVTFRPGQVADEDDDGHEIDVTTGAQIYRCYAAREDVLTDLVAQVYLQNTLTPEQKKRLRSPSGSAASSSGPTATTDGARPEPTATDAGPSTTAATGPATDATAATSSGTTAL